ncbi:uncharacterized protein BDV17DRAFT_136896 [Aspergillus undulatus]|uniref:uncharacterized protein n=1 Tax=Aspergillus undulatus TaxID=1810928 RepID=UPI003CCCBC35
MAPTTRSQAATQTQQPPQPDKSSAYTQPNNPVSHNPAETALGEQEQRSQNSGSSYGTPPASITRGASSQPSNDSSLSATHQKHTDSQKSMQDHEVDTEYGVEEQPSEGSIAQAVEGRSRHRVQAGAHAGAVGSPQGPGAPPKGEGESNLQNLEEKTTLHEQILGDRVGRSPPVPDGVSVENEKVRERKLEQDRRLHPGDVVREATGEPVVGR